MGKISSSAAPLSSVITKHKNETTDATHEDHAGTVCCPGSVSAYKPVAVLYSTYVK